MRKRRASAAGMRWPSVTLTFLYLFCFNTTGRADTRARNPLQIYIFFIMYHIDMCFQFKFMRYSSFMIVPYFSGVRKPLPVNQDDLSR